MCLKTIVPPRELDLYGGLEQIISSRNEFVQLAGKAWTDRGRIEKILDAPGCHLD